MQHSQPTRIPALSTLLRRVRITHRVEDTAHQPCDAQPRARQRVLEPTEQDTSQERRVVFEEVVVSALGTVEELKGLFLLWRLGGGEL